MSSATPIISTSKKKAWAGPILSTLAVLFVGFDTVLHLLVPAPVVEAFARLGIPLQLSAGIGIVELVCVVLYAIPRTSILGAILLTGYLGGASAIHLRAGSSLFEAIFPVIIGALLWAGVYLRDNRLSALVPLRNQLS